MRHEKAMGCRPGCSCRVQGQDVSLWGSTVRTLVLHACEGLHGPVKMTCCLFWRIPCNRSTFCHVRQLWGWEMSSVPRSLTYWQPRPAAADWNEEGVKCTIGSAAGEGMIAQGCRATWEKNIFWAKFQPLGCYCVGKRLVSSLQFGGVACYGWTQVTRVRVVLSFLVTGDVLRGVCNPGPRHSSPGGQEETRIRRTIRCLQRPHVAPGAPLFLSWTWHTKALGLPHWIL